MIGAGRPGVGSAGTALTHSQWMDPMAGADDDFTPPAKTPLPKTHDLQPKYVVGSDAETEARLRELDREKAAETRRAQGRRLSARDRTTIDKLLRRHKSSTRIAELMQDDPATAVFYLKRGKPVLMTVEHLARKITRYRGQQK